MWRKLNGLGEEKFVGLRGPLESGRQSPNGIGGIFPLLVIFLPVEVLMCYWLIVDGWDSSISNIFFFSFMVFCFLFFILSIIFSFKKVFMKYQKVQYALSAIAMQQVIIFFTAFSFFMLAEDNIWNASGHDVEAAYNKYVLFLLFTIVIGIGIIIYSLYLYYKKIEEGEYEEGAYLTELREDAEEGDGSATENMLKVMYTFWGINAVVFGLIILFTFKESDLETIGIVTLCITLAYTMFYILAEQLILLYCKWRFKSFNFDEEEELYPLGSGDKVADQER